MAMDEAAKQKETLAGDTDSLTHPRWAEGLSVARTTHPLGADTHLNWQKMSAYSAEMLDACRTVTRNVKALPRCRWARAVSRGPSRTAFSGLSRRRPSGDDAAGSQDHSV